MSRNDGGPAFPAHEHHIVMEPGKPDTVKVITGKPHGGMTLRDYASIKFQAAILASGLFIHDPDKAAELGQEQADAMLERRDA